MATVGTVKVSISLDERLLAEARRLAPGGNLSAFVARAVARESRFEAMRQWLAEREAELGPLDRERVEQVKRQWAELRSTQAR